MSENKPNLESNWVDPDDAPEWTDEMFDAAEIRIGNKVIRPATGVLTKDGIRPIGRPPIGDAPKKQVTLRLDADPTTLSAERSRGIEGPLPRDRQRLAVAD